MNDNKLALGSKVVIWLIAASAFVVHLSNLFGLVFVYATVLLSALRLAWEISAVLTGVGQ